jgi:hypothetical protein
MKDSENLNEPLQKLPFCGLKIKNLLSLHQY